MTEERIPGTLEAMALVTSCIHDELPDYGDEPSIETTRALVGMLAGVVDALARHQGKDPVAWWQGFCVGWQATPD